MQVFTSWIPIHGMIMALMAIDSKLIDIMIIMSMKVGSPQLLYHDLSVLIMWSIMWMMMLGQSMVYMLDCDVHYCRMNPTYVTLNERAVYLCLILHMLGVVYPMLNVFLSSMM